MFVFLNYNFDSHHSTYVYDMYLVDYFGFYKEALVFIHLMFKYVQQCTLHYIGLSLGENTD